MSLMAAACLAGVFAGDVICSSLAMRNAIGLRCGRGQLLALCEGAGLYESDAALAKDEWRSRNPGRAEEEAGAEAREHVSLPALAADLGAGRMARYQPVNRSLVSLAFDLLRVQWPAKEWLPTLRANGLTTRSWRCLLLENWRTRSWIEREIEAGLSVSAEECAAWYRAHPAAFALPLRLRASHIFFAAPPGSALDLIEQKRVAAQAIIDRLARGEKFSDLAGSSEDEASKKQGGDLNFFTEGRMPTDFWGQVATRRVGEPAALLRTRLGFHIVLVAEARPARQMPLEEAAADIRSRLENEKRVRTMAALTERIIGRVQWNRLAVGSPDLPTP